MGSGKVKEKEKGALHAEYRLATMKAAYNRFVTEFEKITGLKPCFDEEYREALERFASFLSTKPLRPLEDRRQQFLAHINGKFRLNSVQIGELYSTAAELGYTFHYHYKCSIQSAFDLNDGELLKSILIERGISKDAIPRLMERFRPIDSKTTIAHLAAECSDPSKLRREKGSRNIEAEIIKAHFSAFVWCSLPVSEIHAYFDPHFSEAEYRESFWEQLHLRAPHLFSRNHALHVMRVDRGLIEGAGNIGNARNLLCSGIRKSYEKINNHGYLAIILEPTSLQGRNVTWELAADCTLFAEKHRQVKLEKDYFRWKAIQAETLGHLPSINPQSAKFEIANEGYTYRDCFVVAAADGTVSRLILTFQKNERDETPIPCPTCRTSDVQGNSYPSLGVRSWECNNLLCPDRSKYNRGKRYSFRGLATQQAIDDDRNEIPVQSVRRWNRDVVIDATDDDILDMLLRHFSLYGDTVHLWNWKVEKGELLGRKIAVKNAQIANRTDDADGFLSSFLFSRYLPVAAPKSTPSLQNLGSQDFQVYCGDSSEVLMGFEQGFFDAAVTSPPYYNAREYSQWPNMYCYLADMWAVNREVYRTLKPGGLYFYNIFDYFDNERTMVFSAMGQRRMFLSAYTVDLFRRIGFDCLGNIVWDKGDIEGKRGFNAGNFSPYYQSPFNCWEHILVFRKPSHQLSDCGDVRLDYVLRQKPVIKMVRGENTHGHSAPFPDAIPELAIKSMPASGYILDPFGGSLTTGRVAKRLSVRAVCIERSAEYCKLGIKKLADEELERKLAAQRESQLSMF